jgi:hypothetical protein
MTLEYEELRKAAKEVVQWLRITGDAATPNGARIEVGVKDLRNLKAVINKYVKCEACKGTGLNTGTEYNCHLEDPCPICHGRTRVER